MMRIFAGLIAAAALTIFAGAAPVTAEGGLPAAEQKAVEKVISGQIAAFKAGDGKTAFSFAAPNIKAHFKTSDYFMKMVKQQYGAIYDATSVEFRPTKGSGENLVQPVVITGPDGKVYLALYLMEKRDGIWKIGGVSLTQTDQESI